MATRTDNLPPATETPQELERRFWRSLALRPPLYGADVPGSLFDEDLQVGPQLACRSLICARCTSSKPNLL